MPQKNRYLKASVRVFGVTYLVALAGHIILLRLGIAWVGTGFVIVCLPILAVTRFLRGESGRGIHVNAQVIVISTVISVMFAEVMLRVLDHDLMTYSERNGKSYYMSPYRKAVMESLVHRHLYGRDDAHLYTSGPFSTVTRSKTEFTYTRNYNSLGLRGIEPDTSANRRNVIIAGDSFVEGVGVEWDSTFVAQLNKHLLSKDSQIQVINSGYSGSDVFFELKKIEHLVTLFQVDKVILFINSSDIDDFKVRGGHERFAENGTLVYRDAPWFEPMYGASFIVRAICHRILGLDRHLLSERQSSEMTKEALSSICELIQDEYSHLALKAGFELIVVPHPLLHEVCSVIPLEACLHSVEGARILHGLNEQLRQSSGSDCNDLSGLYYPMDGHFTNKGHRVVAEFLKSSIKPN